MLRRCAPSTSTTRDPDPISTATDLCPASLADMTMADPAVNACPYAYYARLHAEAPVHYDARMGL